MIRKFVKAIFETAIDTIMQETAADFTQNASNMRKWIQTCQPRQRISRHKQNVDKFNNEIHTYDELIECFV